MLRSLIPTTRSWKWCDGIWETQNKMSGARFHSLSPLSEIGPTLVQFATGVLSHQTHCRFVRAFRSVLINGCKDLYSTTGEPERRSYCPYRCSCSNHPSPHRTKVHSGSTLMKLNYEIFGSVDQSPCSWCVCLCVQTYQNTHRRHHPTPSTPTCEHNPQLVDIQSFFLQ